MTIEKNSHISFLTSEKFTDDTEILRFEPNGNIYIRGKLTTNDMEIVDAMRQFLIASGHIKNIEKK